MVSKCPCKSRRCVCNIDGDGGIYFTGNGSTRQPYIPRWFLWDLVPEDSSQVNISITGSGTSGDPWVVTIATLGGTVQRTVYTNDGTWVKPISGSVAQVTVIGGGGGGGGSNLYSAAGGGSGGAGGAMSVAWLVMDDLPEEVDVRVGQGGLGGGIDADNAFGGDGGESWFGEYLYAGGGRGGRPQNVSRTPFTTEGGTPPEGGPGGAGSVRTGAGSTPAEDHPTFLSPTGGGMGEGQTIARTLGGTIGPGLTLAGEGGDGAEGLSSGGGEPGGLYGGGGGGGNNGGVLDGVSWIWEGGNGAPGVVVVTVW